MNKRIAFFVAGTALVAGTPSMALGAALTEVESGVPAESGSVADNGEGDAVVTLMEETTPPIYPGQDAWVVLPWNVKNAEAREFEVTSISSDGIEIAYPENTGSYTSLFNDSTLSTFEIDYTALRVHVDPEAAAPRLLNITVSYVSDTGEHTEVVDLPVDVDDSPFDGVGLSVEDGLLGSMASTDIQWFSVDMLGLEDASNVELRVSDAGPFGVVYPAERDHSRPRLGRSVDQGNNDVAALRFETEDVSPGTYTVTVDVTYFVGVTPLTLTIEREIEVVAGINESVLYDSTQALGNWTINPVGTDSADTGQWDLSVPEAAEWQGTATQLGYTPSGAAGVITTGALGSDIGANDVDGGLTSALSPVITLPEGETIDLTLSYYFAYLYNADRDDYFRLSIVSDSGSEPLIYHTARGKNRAATWKTKSFDLSDYAGQDIQILLEAADEGDGSLIEAAVADILITKAP